MITFAAIAPHSPILLPTIGKEHQKKLAKTLNSYQALAEDIYAAKPDTIVILSPHSATLPDAYALLISPSYRANLKEFGDLTTELEFKTDLQLIETLRKLRLSKNATPLVGLTSDSCDYGVTVPLYFLARNLPNIRAVEISSSQLTLTEHFKVGKEIGDTLQRSTKRIAVIASSDLAHTLTDAAPGGFSPDGKKFDSAVVEAMRKDDVKKLLALESKMGTAKACGLRTIVMLLGILDEINCTAEPLSYEGPFGVGYLTARYTLR